MVPKDWEYSTLESLCEPSAPITYGVLKPGDYFADGIPLLQIKDLLSDLSEPQCLHHISPELDEQYRRSRIKTNDILISLVGTVGRIGIVPKQLNNANIHRNLGRIRTKSFEFLVHYLHSDIAKNRFGISSSGSSQSALNLTVLRSLKVPVPPFPEQQKIAKILSTWDKAIGATERLIENSTQQKKALMQQLLTGKKRLFDDEGKRFEGEWKFSSFESLFKVANNKKTQIKSSDYLEEGPVPIVDQGKQLVSGYTNNNEVYLDIPVIVFGDHTRIVKWIDFEFAQGADGTQVLKNMKNLHAKFAYYLLLNTDIPNLGYSRHMRELKEKDFRYPLEKKEQRKIATVLTNADKEIELLEQQLADLQQEKKALMQVLLTGKKRVVVDGEG